MTRSLSIPEWHRMAKEGSAPPVRIRLNGTSMFPLVRMNKDYVTIIPLDREPVVGDIVLFNEPETGRYVVHRVWEIRDGEIRTWGDNYYKPDAWISMSSVWGKVSIIERGRRSIRPNPKKGVRWAKFWHKIGIIYRRIGRIRQGLIRLFRKNKP